MIAVSHVIDHCQPGTHRAARANYTLSDRQASRSTYRIPHIVGSSVEHPEGIQSSTTQLGVLHNFTIRETNTDVAVCNQTRATLG